MGIPGLSTYIARNPVNFTPFELHNTRLVVDACNLVNHLYRQSSLPMHYGGEYMDFTICVRIFLKQLRKCRITPIFVFDGCHSPEGSKRETLLRRNRERIRSLSTFLQMSQHADVDSLRSVPDILPKWTNQTFIELLHECGMPYLTCEREVDTHVAELALFLDCPLLSNDSDFYLFQPDTVPSATVYRVVPLVSLDPQPKRLAQLCRDCSTDHRSQCCFALTCSLFRPSQSVLKCIWPPLIPLLAVLVGNDVFSACRLPAAAEHIFHSSPQPGMSYNQRRIHSIIQWLSGFGRDTEACVRALMCAYEPAEWDSIVKQMIHCVLGYLLHPSQNGPELTALLRNGARTRPARSNRGKAPVPRPTPGRGTGALDQCVTALSNALSGEVTHSPSLPTEFRRRWPPALYACFDSGRVSTSLFDAVYVRGGTVLRILFENLQFTPSIYAVSEPLRSLTYSLLLEIEGMVGGGTESLCGLQNGKPVENRRHNDDMLQFSVNLPPPSHHLSRVSLQPMVSVTDFLSACLQIRPPADDPIQSKELRVLFYVLTLWYRNSLYQFRSTSLALRSNSLGLAYLACVLVTFEHCRDILNQPNALQYAIAELCEHYAKLANSAKQACVSRPTSVAPPFSIPVMHQLNELQLICMDFKSLVDLFDCRMMMMMGHQSQHPPSFQYLRFLPGWVLFPSGRLLYWMVQDVETVAAASQQRVRHVSDRWIPHLLAIFSHDRPEFVSRVTGQFVALLSAVESRV